MYLPRDTDFPETFLPHEIADAATQEAREVLREDYVLRRWEAAQMGDTSLQTIAYRQPPRRLAA